MRRTNWPRHTLEFVGTGSRGLAPRAAPTYEPEALAPAPAVGDHHEGDTAHGWSAWLDLGGEG